MSSFATPKYCSLSRSLSSPCYSGERFSVAPPEEEDYYVLLRNFCWLSTCEETFACEIVITCQCSSPLVHLFEEGSWHVLLFSCEKNTTYTLSEEGYEMAWGHPFSRPRESRNPPLLGDWVVVPLCRNLLQDSCEKKILHCCSNVFLVVLI